MVYHKRLDSPSHAEPKHKSEQRFAETIESLKRELQLATLQA
jgi:hypothetical protein